MTKNQRLFFTAEMSLGMGSIMSLLGNFFSAGLTAAAWHSFLLWWAPTVAVAFAYNLSVASTVTNWLIRRRPQANPSTIRSWTMIVIMCLSMCTFGLITGGGLSHLTLLILGVTWVRSFILAYTIRGLAVKPLAQHLLNSLKDRFTGLADA